MGTGQRQSHPQAKVGEPLTMMTVNTVSWMINVAAPRTWKVIEVQKMKAKKYWMTYKQDTVGQSI